MAAESNAPPRCRKGTGDRPVCGTIAFVMPTTTVRQPLYSMTEIVTVAVDPDAIARGIVPCRACFVVDGHVIESRTVDQGEIRLWCGNRRMRISGRVSGRPVDDPNDLYWLARLTQQEGRSTDPFGVNASYSIYSSRGSCDVSVSGTAIVDVLAGTVTFDVIDAITLD